MSEMIRLPMMRRGAEIVRAGSDEGDEWDYRVDVIWTAGTTVRRRKYELLNDRVLEYDEELVVKSNAVRLDALNSGAPFLDTHGQHSLANVLGSVVPGSARVKDGKGYATIQLSRSDADRTAVEKIRDGIIRNVSVGYRIHSVEKKDRKDGVPLHRVVDWEPMEISAVPIGADSGAQVMRGSDGDHLYECLVSRAAQGAHEARRARMRMFQRHHGL